MKKRSLLVSIILITSVIILPTIPVSVGVVTISPKDGFENNGRNIAVNSSGVIFTSYYDGTNVEYKKSTDGGKTWGGTTTISVESSDPARDTVMCVDSNDNLHFLWKNGTDATKHHKCYWVGNDTWTPRIDTIGIGNWGVLVPDDSGNVHVIFGDLNGSAKEELSHRVWDGDSWSNKTQIRNNRYGQGNFRVEASINSTGGIHAVWQGFDAGSTWAVYYSTSDDNGTTWSTPLQIDNNLGDGHGPSIAVDSLDNLHVLWQGKDATHNQVQAVYRKYSGSWGTVSYLTDDDTDVAHVQPTIAVDQNDTIYAVWTDDNGDASNHLIVMRTSEDGGSTWGEETRPIDCTDDTRNPIALHYINPVGSGGIPYRGLMFAYIHDYGGNPEHNIYYSSDWILSNSFQFSNESPTDLGFGVLQPWCHVDVSLTGGGSFNVSFWENSTGSWIKRQTNDSVTNGTFWWQFTQISSYQTTYYWRVQATNSSLLENIIYRFTSLQVVKTTGETITQCNLFRYVDDSIVATYDLINDTSNYTLLFPALRESSGWIADGAGTITLIDGTWYITHRQRTGDTYRGHYIKLDSSTDLTSWSNVWTVSKNDVTPKRINSFERLSLRYYRNSYYLYFCYDEGGSWDVSYINAPTPEDLEYSLLNSNNWTTILAGAKDPEVYQHNGTYYFSTSLGLYKDDNPEGSSITFIVDFTQMYKDTYGGGDGYPGYNTGTIMFDNSSGYFIHWRTVSVDFDEDNNVDDILWFFATSGDLENWEATDRHVKVKDWTVDTAALLGYPSYFATESETVYLLDWKDAKDDRGFYLWVYDEPTSNNYPFFSIEAPVIETIGVRSQPVCTVQVNDGDNDTITINFYENSTGGWFFRPTNASVVGAPDRTNNMSYWWQFTQVSSQSTQNPWKVSGYSSVQGMGNGL